MDLYNNEVILSRREKRALGLSKKCLAATALGGVWQDVSEALEERVHELHANPPPYQLVIGPFGAVLNACSPTRGLVRQIEKDRVALHDMMHAVLSISQETLPEEVNKSADL